MSGPLTAGDRVSVYGTEGRILDVDRSGPDKTVAYVTFPHGTRPCGWFALNEIERLPSPVSPSTTPHVIAETLAQILGVDISGDGPVSDEQWAAAASYLDDCMDAARDEGAVSAAERRADEREYARSRGVR